eukprot:176481-Lingulodinium_polyedra.AAC.1
MLDDVWRRIRTFLPQHLHTPWYHINHQGTSYRDEAAMNATASWIAQHGEEQGFRPPHLRERARAIGAH